MLANTLGGSAQFSFIAGEFEEAISSAEESLGISHKIGNLSGVSFGETTLGLVYLERGEYSQALTRLREAVDRGVEADNALATTGIRAELAWALACVGALDEGLPLAEAAEKEARAHYTNALDWTGGVLARIRLRAIGSTHRALETRESLPAFGEEQIRRPNVFGTPALGLAAAEVAIRRDELESALETTERLILHLKKIAARHLLADALQLRGRVMLGQGRMAEARRSFEEARKVAETIGANRVLWSILDDLAGIEAARGEEQAAEALRTLARRMIETIIDHIDDEGYKSTFRRIPDVVRVLTAEPPSGSTTHS
jgi:tetratricopeptide (TPR) repeat protein